MLTVKSDTGLFTFHKWLQSEKYTTRCIQIQTEGKIFIACAEKSFLPGILKCRKSEKFYRKTQFQVPRHIQQSSLRSDKGTNSGLYPHGTALIPH